jgi:hypothetical protein
MAGLGRGRCLSLRHFSKRCRDCPAPPGSNMPKPLEPSFHLIRSSKLAVKEPLHYQAISDKESGDASGFMSGKQSKHFGWASGLTNGVSTKQGLLPSCSDGVKNKAWQLRSFRPLNDARK